MTDHKGHDAPADKPVENTEQAEGVLEPPKRLVQELHQLTALSGPAPNPIFQKRAGDSARGRSGRLRGEGGGDAAEQALAGMRAAHQQANQRFVIRFSISPRAQYMSSYSPLRVVGHVQVGDHEAGVRPQLPVLGLHHDPPLARPGPRRVVEVVEQANRRFACSAGSRPQRAVVVEVLVPSARVWTRWRTMASVEWATLLPRRSASASSSAPPFEVTSRARELGLDAVPFRA